MSLTGIREWWRNFSNYCYKHNRYPSTMIGCEDCCRESIREGIAAERQAKVDIIADGILQAMKEKYVISTALEVRSQQEN